MAIAEPLAPLAARFAEAGHEFALVGGPVRDIMLGRQGAADPVWGTPISLRKGP